MISFRTRIVRRGCGVEVARHSGGQDKSFESLGPRLRAAEVDVTQIEVGDEPCQSFAKEDVVDAAMGAQAIPNVDVVGLREPLDLATMHQVLVRPGPVDQRRGTRLRPLLMMSFEHGA